METDGWELNRLNGSNRVTYKPQAVSPCPAWPTSPAACGWRQRRLDRHGSHQCLLTNGAQCQVSSEGKDMDASLPLCGIYTGVSLGPREWEVIRNPWSKMMSIYHSVSFDRQQGSKEKLFLNMLLLLHEVQEQKSFKNNINLKNKKWMKKIK